MSHPIATGLYRHYKGGLYRVLHVATDSTNARQGALVVVYLSLEKGLVHVRDQAEFIEEGFPEQLALAGGRAHPQQVDGRVGRARAGRGVGPGVGWQVDGVGQHETEGRGSGPSHLREGGDVMALSQAVVDAAPRILDLKPGDVVRHRKRETEYFIRHVGASRLQCGDSRHDGSPLVEYVAIEAPHDVWHRPLAEFTEDRFVVMSQWSEWVDVARAKVDALVAERRRLLAGWPGTVEAFDAAPEHLGLRQSIAAKRADVERMLGLQAVLEGRR